MKKNKSLSKASRLAFIFLASLLIVFSCINNQQTQYKAEWPKTNQETKPWTRWWWHGSAVNKADITANLEELKSAGIGGVEITPIYGVKGYEDKDLNFLSSEWMEMFSYTLKEAKRLDLGVDLANASGWPFGGPWVSADDACKNVQYKFYSVKGGKSLKEKIEFIQEPLVRAVGHKVDISEVKFPISSNKNLQELALDQVRFKKKIPLQTLIAYNENGQVLELTDKVDANGILDWKAPEGNWKLCAVFMGWHGKMVERAGRGGEGNVIDHFSETAAKNFLDVYDKNSADFDLSGLRAFFNDSYEVDDASGEADWTPLMFEEFKKLRGYDLKEYLPALFGQDSEEMNSRVLCDYKETISDLLLSRFTKVWADWAQTHNATIRNQAHGSPANILDLYAASDIPETEGTSPMRLKMATSAGHVSGKPLIACEAATWLDEHFRANLADVKQNFDRYLANGVNHIVYHGTPYSPVKEEWPGWMFYAAVHFAPTNTWWEDLKTINNYVENCQSFLQNSEPANDILLYFPIYDTWSKQENSRIHHFGTKVENLTKELSESLLTKGYTFDYISDRQIKKLTVDDKIINSANAKYKTILIPDCEYIPLATIQKIVELAEQGATIIFQNDLPKDVPGFYQFKERQKVYQQLLASLQFKQDQEFEISTIGSGQVFKGKKVDILLEKADVFPESMAENGLWFSKVMRPEGTCYFISNWTDKEVKQWLPINSGGEDAVIFNPMDKKYGKAQIKESASGQSQVYIQLAKGETLILQWYSNKQELDIYPFYETTDDVLPINSEWTVEFVTGGPTLPEAFKMDPLADWTQHSDVLKHFSGTARYKTSFEMPAKNANAYLLELGEVHESAIVLLNGEKIKTLTGPVFQVVIPVEKLKQSNTLEVLVTNLMANRIIDMDKRGVVYKKFYNINFAAHVRQNLSKDGTFTSAHWEPLKSGLIGPVSLTALKEKK